MLVPQADDYDICYAMEGATYAPECCRTGTVAPDCYTCSYEVKITISAAEGCTFNDGKPMVYPNDPDAEAFVSLGDIENCFSDLIPELSDLALDVGSYTVTKELRVSQVALENNLAQYLDNTDCVQSEDAFVEQYTIDTDYSSCTECDCNLPESEQPDECRLLCEQRSPCQQLREQMLADVRPGGQYATYDRDLNGGVTVTKNCLNLLALDVEQTGEDASRIYQKLIDPSRTVVIGGFTQSVAKLNIQEFVDNFSDDWLEDLLPYHPEYCQLDWCDKYTDKEYRSNRGTSNEFDALLRRTETAAAAKRFGLLPGSDASIIFNYDNIRSNVTRIKAMAAKLAGEDPFFDSVEYGDGNNTRRNFIQDRLAYRVERNEDLPNVNDIASVVAFGMRTYNDSRSWTYAGAATSLQDVAWRIYRDQYLSRKAVYLVRQQTKYCTQMASREFHGNNFLCLDQKICNGQECDESSCSDRDESCYSNYTARVARIDLINFVDEPPSFSSEEEARAAEFGLAAQRAFCDTNCTAYRPAWRTILRRCPVLAADMATTDRILDAFEAICKTGCDDSGLGTSEVPNGVSFSGAPIFSRGAGGRT